MAVMIILVLLLFLNIMSGSAADKINLLVHTLSSTHRYCVELPKLCNNQTVNINEFGWYTASIAPISINACNIANLSSTFPNGLNSRTLIVLFKHECDIIEHVWNVQQQFGTEISLMIVQEKIETSCHKLTTSAMPVSISIPVLIFRHDDFIKMNKSLDGNTNNIRFSIDYPLEEPQKFYLASLFMFPLVLVTLIMGHSWAADEFVKKKNGIKTYTPSDALSTTIIGPISNNNIRSSTPSPDDTLAPVSSEQHNMLPLASSSHSDDAPVSMEAVMRAMNNIATASTRLTAITRISLRFILSSSILLIIGLLFSFYFPLVQNIIVPKIFCISAALSFTLCLDRLSCFVPTLRRYRISPSTIFKSIKYRLNFVIIFDFCLSLVIVTVWYINRQSQWAWILQDTLGAAICISIMSRVRSGNMIGITVVLVGFCLIDIFFVFVTPYIPLFQLKSTSTGINRTLSRTPSVMEQFLLGTEVNGHVSPVVFILPKTIPQSKIDPCSIVRPTMLGFGDVVIPSFLLTFCKLFDIMSKNRWPIYYIQSIISYSLGLLLAYIARYFMNTAQPALLYLVPCILLSTIITGLWRRELKQFFRGACIQEFLSENEKIIQDNEKFVRSECNRVVTHPEVMPNSMNKCDFLIITMDLHNIKKKL